MAPHVSADLDRNPTAGLVSINTAKSCAAWVEISITGDGDGPPTRLSCSASSKPLSLPRLMSTSATSGRNSSKSRSASALVDATPTTVMPSHSSNPRAAPTPQFGKRICAQPRDGAGADALGGGFHELGLCLRFFGVHAAHHEAPEGPSSSRNCAKRACQLGSCAPV